MKLSLGVVASVLLTAATGCSANADGASTTPAARESDVTEHGAIPAGKYIAAGPGARMLMIYGACSEANFLGEAARGEIDASGVMRAPEGDVCGGYKLTAAAEGEVKVTWNRDPSAHLDAATISACKSQEGTYLMTQPGAFRDAKPGVYAKPNSAATFTVPAGCDTPASLSGGGAVIARTESNEDHPAGYLRTDEGNVCEGYTYTGLADGTLKITWAPPKNASVAHNLGISAACKSVEGVYKPR